jgi:hypothetical protein
MASAKPNPIEQLDRAHRFHIPGPENSELPHTAYCTRDRENWPCDFEIAYQEIARLRRVLDHYAEVITPARAAAKHPRLLAAKVLQAALDRLDEYDRA